MRKVENDQFKAEKWSGLLIQTDTLLDKLSMFFLKSTFHTAEEVLKGEGKKTMQQLGTN